jgi:hypothetical protein
MFNIKSNLLTCLLFVVANTSFAQDIFPEDGWWWDADASGRGYMIERQGDFIFMSSFHYTELGDPEWLIVSGTYLPADNTSSDIGELDGNVTISINGQAIGADYIAPVTSVSEQDPFSLVFHTNQSATLNWTNETVELTRFFWGFENSLDQLNGSWLIATVAANADFNETPTAKFVIISSAGNTASIENGNGIEVGSITLTDGELTIQMDDLDESVSLIIPETKRFYAGNRNSDSQVVIGLKIDDFPIVFVDDATETGTAESTDGVLCTYSQTKTNNQSSLTITSTSTWTCSNGSRFLTANGIPNHEVGDFPNQNNPNTIGEVNVSASFTLSPVETTVVSELGGPRGVTGYVLNGVKIDAGTAGSCDDSGTSCSLIGNNGNWSIEALGQTSFNFGTDDNNAHVQPTGDYHYHGMPENYLAEQGADSSKMTLIGWAADGFPIYARYGYSDANDASSDLIVVTGSFQFVSEVSSSRPSTTTFPLGTFQQDWEYVEGLGDLDECNGRVGVTPEFPGGIYHYYATDSYPYFQRCVKGALN